MAEELDVDGDGAPDAPLYPADCLAPLGVLDMLATAWGLCWLHRCAVPTLH